jgi:hypothetical protein
LSAAQTLTGSIAANTVQKWLRAWYSTGMPDAIDLEIVRQMLPSTPYGTGVREIKAPMVLDVDSCEGMLVRNPKDAAEWGIFYNGKASLAMDSLKRLAGGAFSLHYVLLLAAANFPKPLFDHFVAQLESFLFYYIFTKTPTKDLERSFSQWADELRAIAAATDPVKQKMQLNAFIADRFDTNMAGKSQELVDALRRFTLYSMQQYRTRYLLARLTQHVEMAFSGLKMPGSLEPFTKLEIEHILPDNPKEELRGKWGAENPSAGYDDCKNRLGNLTLLEKPINIVAGNDFYSAKRAEYRKSGNYLTRSLVELASVGQNTSISRINEKLKAFPAWNAKAIEERHGLLITLAQDVWKTSPIDI